MCGIMGMAGLPSGFTAAETTVALRSMGHQLRHRGPDGWGEYIGKGTALGHTRLSILDLELGKQPMISEDGGVVLVFNGEIYNFRELWRELESKGHRFRTDHSDTEVILNGYREWGEDVFQKLDGMFAVAIWDSTSKTLWMARDRIGIKPLYYALLPPAGIVFASEPKAILECGLVSASFDATALPEYFLHRAVPAPRTLWNGISKAPPGHILSFREGEMHTRRYWYPRAAGGPKLRMPEAVEMVEDSLTQAVRSHLVADVPVGVFLSGGVDSSLVAAFASRFAEPQAFTIGSESECDEIPFASEVAQLFGLRLHTHVVKPEAFLSALDEWLFFNDDPVSDPSSLALLLLSRTARERGMKVMLSGEGSDELFCGYASYVRYHALRSMQRIPLASAALRLLKSRLDPRTADYLEQQGVLTFMGTGHVTSNWMRREMFSDIDPDLPSLRADDDGPCSPLRRALLFDQRVRLPNDILARTDRATMAAGIEGRVPFLDGRVIETANSLDDGCCLTPWSCRTKPILKRLLRKHLSSRLVYRKKIGFDLPIGRWLRHPFRAAVTEFLSERRIPGIRYAFWSRLYESHCTGQKNYAAPLWAWLVLEQWHRKWAGKPEKNLPASAVLKTTAPFA